MQMSYAMATRHVSGFLRVFDSYAARAFIRLKLIGCYEHQGDIGLFTFHSSGKSAADMQPCCQLILRVKGKKDRWTNEYTLIK